MSLSTPGTTEVSNPDHAREEYTQEKRVRDPIPLGPRTRSFLLERTREDSAGLCRSPLLEVIMCGPRAAWQRVCAAVHRVVPALLRFVVRNGAW